MITLTPNIELLEDLAQRVGDAWIASNLRNIAAELREKDAALSRAAEVIERAAQGVRWVGQVAPLNRSEEATLLEAADYLEALTTNPPA